MRLDSMTYDQLILHVDMPKIFYVTQQWYTELSSKDPHAIYIICNSVDNRIYHGEVLIAKSSDIPKYFISTADKYGQYSIYINYRENYMDRLVKIADYDSIQHAVNDLNTLNKVGYHSKVSVHWYNIICSYLRKEISIQDMFIGIIAAYGYDRDPLLQALIEYCLSLGVSRTARELPPIMIQNLPHMKKRNLVFNTYSNLYDLMVEFNHLKDDKYEAEHQDPDLSAFISKIPRCFNSFNDPAVPIYD